MTRWTALAAGACAASALSLAAISSAGAQTYIVEDAYAAAPPPVVDIAPPVYGPASVYVAAPERVYAPRRVYVAPSYYVPPPAARVVVPDGYVTPGYVGGYVEAGW